MTAVVETNAGSLPKRQGKVRTFMIWEIGSFSSPPTGSALSIGFFRRVFPTRERFSLR